MNQYTCQICKGTFVCERPEADKREEYAIYFPGASPEEPVASVCDDCWHRDVLPELQQQTADLAKVMGWPYENSHFPTAKEPTEGLEPPTRSLQNCRSTS